MRELRRHHPDADVHTLHLSWDEPRTALLDHRVDAVVARLPFSTDQLHVTILYDEPRLLLVPVDHRLAGKDHVTLDDIADEPLPQLPDAAWSASTPAPTAAERPKGRWWRRWRTNSSSSPPGMRSPLPPPVRWPSTCAPTSPRSPWKGSNPATWSSPPVQVIATA
ncbi:LysR substrate-binding domain-containing protein [Streptomyces goshikiensis]|uniref:LysR substrate-binding domain-containing protein n=1 Tax=Streptomyces goshikiensis TaxID=1942 RepID=UPI003714A17B